MTRPATTPRPGFTLVELLVAITVVIALASIALLVVPDVLSQDRTTDAAGTVRQTLMIAKARAQRDNLPRGVRLLTGTDPSNVVKLNAGTVGQFWVTELQFVEQPTPLVPKPDERVEIEFGLVPPADPNAGSLQTPPNVFYMAMSPEIEEYLNTELGGGRPVELRMLRGGDPITLTLTGQPPAVTGPIVSGTRIGPRNFQLTVDWVKSKPSLDALVLQAEAGTVLGLSGFWINRPAQPLLGEPLVALPQNTCIDLNFGVSRPSATAGQNFEIIFAPSGEVLYWGQGQLFLWVRDYTKVADMTPLTPTAALPNQPYTYNTALQQFQRGGEQQVVALKTKSGSLGVAPVLWPRNDGTYNQVSPGVYDDPFTLARQGTGGP
ncbi:MAG: hypothetical protein K2X82_00115 [Gemmataceae bacterium]|nr:hypothetical protein [Gemmataceae bacterium]